jgi:hypothetical protein
MPAHVGLRRPLQAGQVRGPEPIQEVTDGREAIRAHQEQMAGALALLADEARTSEDPQMMGDDLLGDSKLQRYLPNSQWAVANLRQYPAPGTVRQRVQSSVDRFRRTHHGANSSIHLYKCQLVDGGGFRPIRSR